MAIEPVGGTRVRAARIPWFARMSRVGTNPMLVSDKHRSEKETS